MKAAKMGQMSSQIGVVLRHQHGIPLVKSIASSKILHILKAHGEISPPCDTPTSIDCFMRSCAGLCCLIDG